MIMQFDLQLFGGGGSRTETVEVPVYQSSAPSSSAVSTESVTDSERQKTQEKIAKAKGRRYTNTGAGMNTGALAQVDTSSAAASIAKRLLGE